MYMDWIALLIGTIGTALWAHNGKSARLAAPLWLASSLIWMVYAYINGLSALGARDFISVSLYGYGIWRWCFPRKKAGVSKVEKNPTIGSFGADPE